MKSRLVLACLISCGLCTAHASGDDASHSAISRGHYLADAGDCAACHTAEGGKPFAGGRPIPTPFGTIYSTNITPDPATGIGLWTEEDFYKAMHQGIRRDGKHLYPAFPYPWYSKLSREDVDAIKAYLDALQPVRQANKESELPWPLSVREVMAGWNSLFFDEGSYRPDARQSAQWNRGAYLVEGLGHCGACHTPKNVLGGPKRKDHLEGGYGENWYATSLTNDVRDGLGDWSLQDIVEYLKTGSNVKAAATGPMAEVIANSTQHLNDADLYAIATYLKSVTPTKERQAKPASGDRQSLARGEAVYIDQCAGCHMKTGEGQPGVFPPLKGNAVVQAKDPETILHMVLGGARVVATRDKPTGLAMPAFDWKLSDQDAADLASYLRSAWGNRAGPVTVSEVKKTRERIQSSRR
jgi:mono/diheme cytochrome c family protein